MALPRRCLHGVHLWYNRLGSLFRVLCLGAACTECIFNQFRASFQGDPFASALPARSASISCGSSSIASPALPRRCLHGVHLCFALVIRLIKGLCLGAACTECIRGGCWRRYGTTIFASALPARSASAGRPGRLPLFHLCLGAACTECISCALKLSSTRMVFASALPARSASLYLP